jgi:hypothetical protein
LPQGAADHRIVFNDQHLHGMLSPCPIRAGGDGQPFGPTIASLASLQF